MSKLTVNITVNNKKYKKEIHSNLLLVDFLRDNLKLTGTHIGCDTSQCGACMVMLNGEAVKSCSILVAQLENKEIVTIENISENDKLHPMQEAFRNNHGLQCGFCTPGMIISAISLVKENNNPNEADIRKYIEGNFCRCTGYHNIIKSISEGAKGMQNEE
tara:strand:- start:5127 stop:5606 length:480 start_codon:yes stop_codon:yes gene_type:complete